AGRRAEARREKGTAIAVARSLPRGLSGEGRGLGGLAHLGVRDPALHTSKPVLGPPAGPVPEADLLDVVTGHPILRAYADEHPRATRGGGVPQPAVDRSSLQPATPGVRPGV